MQRTHFSFFLVSMLISILVSFVCLIIYVLLSCFRVFIFLVFFIGSFTAILNQINKSLWDPELYEGLFGLDDETVARIIPTLSGLTQTLLFTVCPQIFKIVSFKSGVATSFESSEQRAMIYFWYFYLVVRYLGQLVVESFEKFTAGSEYNMKKEVAIPYSIQVLRSFSNSFLFSSG